MQTTGAEKADTAQGNRLAVTQPTPPRSAGTTAKLCHADTSALVHVCAGVDGGWQGLDVNVEALLHLVEGVAVLLQCQPAQHNATVLNLCLIW